MTDGQHTDSAPIDPNIKRLMKQVSEDTRRKWGTGFDLLGPDIQSALLAERLLITINQQDESIDATTIRKFLAHGWTWIIEQTNR